LIEIPKLARIIAVAESFDALTNGLSNIVMSREDAVQEIRKQAGVKYDPDIVDIFVKMILEVSI
jgi:HD-GYP domain-containing protein (c-di-GMP phosphodiesterase class II)